MQPPESKKQKIILTEHGLIVESDNRLFHINNITQHPAQFFFPLLDSIFESVIKMDSKDLPVRIPRVTTFFKLLPGIYDFTFSRFEKNNEQLILWTIEDFTEKYSKIKAAMQEENEKAIREEHKTLGKI